MHECYECGQACFCDWDDSVDVLDDDPCLHDCDDAYIADDEDDLGVCDECKDGHVVNSPNGFECTFCGAKP